MINIFKYCLNWLRLKSVERTINKYRLHGEDKLNLKFKPLLKRPIVIIIRIRVNGKTVALLITSQKKNQPRITHVDFIWINKKKCIGATPETESAYYQAIYDIFMHWHEDVIVRSLAGKKLRKWDYVKKTQWEIAISINVTQEQQVERFRRILTIYGFHVSPELTLQDIDFVSPYREKEHVKNIVYTRYI